MFAISEDGNEDEEELSEEAEMIDDIKKEDEPVPYGASHPDRRSESLKDVKAK